MEEELEQEKKKKSEPIVDDDGFIKVQPKNKKKGNK